MSLHPGFPASPYAPLVPDQRWFPADETLRSTAYDIRELVPNALMVRRTRSFVERNYAFTECPACATVVTPTREKCPQCDRLKTKEDRRFLILEGGNRFHFPNRLPTTLTFRIRDDDPNDQYARLYSDIRLIQRAGRVDRIGQNGEGILCDSFLPAEGVERLIRLRSRVRQRLHEDAEVVGTDETFFEDEKHEAIIRDLFTGE